MSTPPTLIPEEELTPDAERLVLEALNTASTPEEIVRAMAFPGAPVMVPGLAEQILRTRDLLGGFTDLRQVRAVRAAPDQFGDVINRLASSQRAPLGLEELRAEVAALRASITINGRTPLPMRKLSVRAVQPNHFLGQPVSLTATLTEGGNPAVDVPVTFIATRGVLRANDGYTTHQGHLITARTGVDGIVRLTALPTTTEELTQQQADTLASALGLINPLAATPADAIEDLRMLAHKYNWEINLPLRQAIDIFVSEFQPMLLDTVNPRDYLAAWSYEDTAILAFAPVEGTGDDGSSVSATATMHLRVRNWIPAFLETFVAVVQQQNELTDQLKNASKSGADGAGIASSIYESASEYVGSRWGNVGTYVGRKVAETSIRSFIDTDLQEMPIETRVAVFPTLEVASKTVASADPGVFRAIVGTRTEIAQQVENKTSAAQTELAGLRAELGTLNTALGERVTSAQLESAVATRLTRADLDTELATRVTRADLDGALASRVTRADLDGALATRVARTDFDAALATRVTRTEFNTALATRVTRTEFTTAIATKVDRTAFDTSLAGVATRTDLTNGLANTVSRDELSSALANTVDNTRFDAALASRVDQAQLDQALASRVDQAQLDQALASRVDRTQFDAALADVVKSADFKTALEQTVNTTDFKAAIASTVTRTDFNAAIANTVTRNMFNTAFANTISRTEFNTAIAKTVSLADFQTALATTVTRTDLTTALASTVSLADFQSALQTTVTRADFDTALASTVTRTEFTSALSTTATKAELSSALATTATKAELSSLQTSVNTRFTTLNSNVTTLNTRLIR